MHPNQLSTLLLIISLLYSHSLLAKTDNEPKIGNANKGKILSKTCIGCHGIDGNSISDAFPKIAGQHSAYSLKQLKNFKNKKRFSPLMAGIVAPLTEENIADLSEFFASQAPKPTTVKQNDKLFTLGQKLYRGGNIQSGTPACSACHGPSGKGIASAKFPALALQHSAYTITQLKAFRQYSLNQKFSDSKKPARENDLNKIMRQATAHLTDIEIKALAHYIATLQ